MKTQKETELKDFKDKVLELLNSIKRILEIVELEDISIKMKLEKIKEIAESIEILTDDKILEGLNSAIDDFKNGRYTVLSNLEVKK